MLLVKRGHGNVRLWLYNLTRGNWVVGILRS